MSSQITHELSPGTEEKFRRAIATALQANAGSATVDAVLDQISDLLVAIDANADARGYERARSQPYDDQYPMTLMSPPVTILTVTRGEAEIVKVRLDG